LLHASLDVRMRTSRIFFLIWSLFIVVVIVVSAACYRKQRRPSRYLVPEGYIGWVRIDFRVKEAPPLLIEDEHYLFEIPASGRLQTSSDMEYGWASSDDFYYYAGDTRQNLTETTWGGGGAIWGQSNGS